ncbi:MAG: hypothetical protein EOM40_06170 [Clostridia bacterium]|nr:hypothetical protein [Clostridia bacterium]
MRKYTIKLLEILHGSVLLSVIYCTIMQQVTHQEAAAFYRSLYLVLVVGAFSILVKKVSHFWQFLVSVVICIAGTWIVIPQGYGRVWMIFAVLVAAFSFFVARASKNTCWLNEPEYPWLIVFLLVYVAGDRFESDFLIQYASIGAGVYYLICNFHTNLIQVDIFMETHSKLERLPGKRLGKINQIMMWTLSGITAIAMFAAPYLGIRELLRKLGHALRVAISWLLSLIPSGVPEEPTEPMMQTQNALSGVLKEPNAFWKILYMIMDILGWIFAIGLVLLFVFMILKTIYGWYRRFNEKIEENGDKIERIFVPPAAEKKRELARGKKENLFWNRSNDARIRKHYKKKVQKDLQEHPDPSWTPEEIEKSIELNNEDKTKFHEYYEKARYGNENCTKEEMESMLSIK